MGLAQKPQHPNVLWDKNRTLLRTRKYILAIKCSCHSSLSINDDPLEPSDHPAGFPGTEFTVVASQVRHADLAHTWT